MDARKAIQTGNVMSKQASSEVILNLLKETYEKTCYVQKRTHEKLEPILPPYPTDGNSKCEAIETEIAPLFSEYRNILAGINEHLDAIINCIERVELP